METTDRDEILNFFGGDLVLPLRLGEQSEAMTAIDILSEERVHVFFIRHRKKLFGFRNE